MAFSGTFLVAFFGKSGTPVLAQNFAIFGGGVGAADLNLDPFFSRFGLESAFWGVF